MKRLRISPARLDTLLFLLFFAGGIWLSFDLMYKEGKPATPGVFYSDKSHYYVYLPATLIYGWDVNRFPEKIDTVYRGFVLDKKQGKVVIKVTTGVALLCSPFFLATHGIALLSGVKADGFSEFYERAALIPPVFFFVLGLWFLRRFLDNYFKRWISLLAVLLVAAGTNLYYYALVEGWMSHIFSFFLFSALLYTLKRYIDGGLRSYPRLLSIALIFALAVLIRPTNILLLLWLALLDVTTLREAGRRILHFLKPRQSLTLLAVGVVVFIPQFLYWYYLSGRVVYYSYPGEGFIFWKSPMMVEVWFAQLNGLFPYNPIVLFMATGILFMIVKKIPNGWFLLLVFLLNTYIIASWHAWFFGGSYGCRPFAEFFSILALPLAWMLSAILSLRNLWLRSTLILAMLLTVLFNQRMIYNPRWNTSSVWAWDDFRSYLDGKDILHFEKGSCTYVNDFENISFDFTVNKTRISCQSPTMACMVVSDYPYACHYRKPLQGAVDQWVRRVEVSFAYNPFVRDRCSAVVVCLVYDAKGRTVLWKQFPVDQPGAIRGRWTPFRATVEIPGYMNDEGYIFAAYLWNYRKSTFLVDDYTLRFE